MTAIPEDLSKLPCGVIEEIKNNFSWTPIAVQLGSRIVSFVAQDRIGTQTTTNVTITVVRNKHRVCSEERLRQKKDNAVDKLEEKDA